MWKREFLQCFPPAVSLYRSCQLDCGLLKVSGWMLTLRRTVTTCTAVLKIWKTRHCTAETDSCLLRELQRLELWPPSEEDGCLEKRRESDWGVEREGSTGWRDEEWKEWWRKLRILKDFFKFLDNGSSRSRSKSVNQTKAVLLMLNFT